MHRDDWMPWARMAGMGGYSCSGFNCLLRRRHSCMRRYGPQESSWYVISMRLAFIEVVQRCRLAVFKDLAMEAFAYLGFLIAMVFLPFPDSDRLQIKHTVVRSQNSKQARCQPETATTVHVHVLMRTLTAGNKGICGRARDGCGQGR
jgi:hypothetical protein